jgi:hypothetical protein
VTFCHYSNAIKPEFFFFFFFFVVLGHMSEQGMLELHKINLLKGAKTCN